MFKTFFLSELSYRFRQPMVYIFFVIIAALVCAVVSMGNMADNIIRDSPYIITKQITTYTMLGLLLAAAFFNKAALKDYSSGFNEILFSTPLSKKGFYFGRFFGALIACTFPFLGVFLGMFLAGIIAPLTGSASTEQFGGVGLYTIFIDYTIFILPNMYIAGALIFAIALKWKSTVYSFVGAMAILVLYLISGSLLSDLDNETTGALLDTFGVRTFAQQTKYYSVLEINTVYPVLEGLLLINRLFWIGVGTVILIVSYLNFSFLEKNEKVKAEKKQVEKAVIAFKKPSLSSKSSISNLEHFKSFFSVSFFSIIRSVTFKVLLVFALILFVTRLFSGFDYLGVKSFPLTYKMIDAIEGSSFVFIIIVIVFFSGELIWRDREQKINEVIDSTPHSSAIALFSKALSLISVASIFHFVFVVIAIFYQLFNGFTRIEIDIYLLNYILAILPTFISWAGILILIQVIFNNKYLAYFVAILIIFGLSSILLALDIETNMLFLSGGPRAMYSDLNGFGPEVLGAVWFNLYWVAFSIMALLIAGLFWNRGIVTSFKARLSNIGKIKDKKYILVTIFSFVAWLTVAGVVYYNTQILNPYLTSKQKELVQAEYEKKFKKYENITLPKIKEIKFNIDVFPKERGMKVQAELKLTNESHLPIDSLHFNLDKDWETVFNIPNSELVLNDKKVDYQIYKLTNSLLPNESINIKITNTYITRGFKNNGENRSIVNNGTFVNNMYILPMMGYAGAVEIKEPNKRKKYGLTERVNTPQLEHDCSGSCMKNYLSKGTADFINVETIISTSSDQIAVAPGSLIKQWKEDGRNYYQYKVDHPSQNFFSFISAKYEISKRDWNGVNIEIYYDKKHSKNVSMMLDAVQRSLEYYTENFGPYYHKQCRIIEFPRYSRFAQAFPGTMPYSESFGFIADLGDKDKNNVIDAVVSHEMAHQWWAHQVVGADMQGGTFMSESFAEYSSLMTMKSINDDAIKMRQFLKYDHDRYLQGRGSESLKERPLYKVENQQYIHYGKGSVILYALQDYIGEDKVNLALKNFLEEFKYKAPPYPTSLDFLKHLEPQVPDSLNYLIDDWFKEITLYDNRIKSIEYSKLEDDMYKVDFNVESKKIKIDSLGVETFEGINDWIDIGLYSNKDEDSLVFCKRVKIDKPTMIFSFTVKDKPIRGGIDPKHLLIDKVYSDNNKSCTLKTD